MPTFNIDDFSVNGVLRYFNGSVELAQTDFVENEVVQLSVITSDGLKEKRNVRFSATLVDAVNKALKNKELKAASVFKI